MEPFPKLPPVPRNPTPPPPPLTNISIISEYLCTQPRLAPALLHPYGGQRNGTCTCQKMGTTMPPWVFVGGTDQTECNTP